MCRENILHTESGPGLIAYDVQQGKYGILGSSHVFPWPYYIFSVDSSIYVGRGNGILQCSLSSGAWRSRTDAPYAGSLLSFRKTVICIVVEVCLLIEQVRRIFADLIAL